MMLKEDFKLTAEQNTYIYENIIRPELFRGGLVDNPKPVAYYLGAQPGSGKTALGRHLDQQTDKAKTVVINNDELRNHHPEYRKLMNHPTEFHKAPVMVNADSTIWLQRVFQDAVNNRYNIIFDSTLGNRDISGFVEAMQLLKKKYDYDIELHILAVKPELSKMGIHLRYENQVKTDGKGRFVEMSTHDLNFSMLPKNIGSIVQNVNVDKLATYTRMIGLVNGEIQNNAVRELAAFNSPGPAEIKVIHDTLKKEWDRPLTEVEKKYFKFRYDQIEGMIKDRSGDLDKFRNDVKDISKYQIESVDFGKINQNKNKL